MEYAFFFAAEHKMKSSHVSQGGLFAAQTHNGPHGNLQSDIGGLCNPINAAP